MPDLEFACYLHGNYRYIPHLDELGERTVKISLPTDYYDTNLGEAAFNEFIEEARLIERLGYDSVVFSEQHGTPNGLSPNPLVLSAAVASATTNLRIAADGPILNAYLTPMRLAEEIAAVDNLSNGRLIVGFPMGIGTNYHSYSTMNPAYARERYREGLDLILKAFTDPGPFAWEGKHFHVPHVNLWPRPVQQPHPPIWIPAAGSRETLKLCAEKKLVYQAVLTPRKHVLRNFQTFQDLCREEGYEPDPLQSIACFMVHVAESDKQARLEVEGHVMWQYQDYHRSTFPDSFPPGHVSAQSLRAMMGGGYRAKDPSLYTWQELEDEGYIIIGSPSTVRERLEELLEPMGAGRVMLMNFASMPMWLKQKHYTLFAEEVVPHFRPPGGAPSWARPGARRPRTAAELAATGEPPLARPIADVEGVGRIDVGNSHVADLRQHVDSSRWANRNGAGDAAPAANPTEGGAA